MDDPEVEGASPGAMSPPELLRNDLRLACLGVLFPFLLGKRIDDDAIDVRGDWAGVKKMSMSSSPEESKPSKSDSSSEMCIGARGFGAG